MRVTTKKIGAKYDVEDRAQIQCIFSYNNWFFKNPSELCSVLGLNWVSFLWAKSVFMMSDKIWTGPERSFYHIANPTNTTRFCQLNGFDLHHLSPGGYCLQKHASAKACVCESVRLRKRASAKACVCESEHHWKRALGVAKRPRESHSAKPRRQKAYFLRKRQKSRKT